MAPLRVLHGPVNVGNQPWVLSRQERALGLRSDLVIAYSTWLQYQADRCLGAHRSRSPLALARRLWFALAAPFRYDVLHCYFGRSFMCWDDLGGPNRWWWSDLRLAKRLGRKVFMTLQGCDVRLSAESDARNAVTMCKLGHCAAAPDCRATLDAQRRAMLAAVLPLADRVFVLNPELAHYVPGAVFMPYCSVDLDALEAIPPRDGGRPVLLHAPTDESIKGSRLIIAAVERLKQRHDLELVLVRGMPHEQAMREYRRADLVIDQTLSGWYGGLAVEAMGMGKPVACYLRDADFGCLPPAMREQLPLVRIAPDTLEADLEAALLRRAEWAEWGHRSREFVRRWHHPRTIAAAMAAAYADPASTFTLGEAASGCAA